MKIKQQIPNIVTSLNLLCGVLGILSLSFYFVPCIIPQNDWAVYLMFAAAFFDFCDGFVARALKVDSPLGKQLDSLADVVTFGVLPGMLMFIAIGTLLCGEHNFFMLALHDLNTPGGHYLQDVYANSAPPQVRVTTMLIKASPYLIPALLVPILSAFRLAKFNIDTRQSHSFIGLPTPANGLFLASVYFAIQHGYVGEIHPALLSALTLIFAILLVSPLPLFAMKFKSRGWKGNEVRFSFLALAVVTIITAAILGKVMAAVPILVILYILISIINNIVTRNQNEV